MTATKPLPAHKATDPAAVRARNAEYARTRNRLQAYGRWDPWTEAQPVRDHIAHLATAGIGWMRAAELAGLPSATVSHWLYGHNGWPPPKQIHADKAAKMLAVKASPESLADHALTDPLITVRRIQTLAADGFPIKYVAERLGRDATNLSRIMRQSHVEVGTARAISALFAELAGTDPAAVGISPRNSTYARNWAAKKGWFTSATWDGKIHNPDADPARWIRVGASDRSFEELVAEAEEIRKTSGASWDLIAERLNVARSTLSEARKRVAERAKAGAA